MHLALFSILASCAVPAPSAEEGSADSGGAGLGASCADAEAAAVEAQAVLDEAVVARDRALAALENLVAMQVLALRAANEPTAPDTRAAADLEFSARRAELATAALDDAALDPGALGLADASLGATSFAALAFLATEGAIDTVRAHAAELDVAVGSAKRAGEATLLGWPACELELVAPAAEAVDTEGPVDAGRVDNLLDASELVDAAEAADVLAADIVQKIRALALANAEESVGAAVRAHRHAEFLDLAAELDRIAASTDYHAIPLTSGDWAMAAVFLDATPEGSVGILLQDLRPAVLGIDSGTIDLTTAATSASAISSVDSARSTVGVHLDELGSTRITIEAEIGRFDGE